MPFRVLLSPEDQEQGRHGRQHHLRAMHPRMAGRAKRDHQLQFRPTRDSMVNDDAPLPRSGCIAHPAAMSVALKNRLPQPTEVLLILAPKRVAGCALALR